jgi:hypothetical protein
VSLTKEIQGSFLSSGALKILNFPLDPLIGLVYKLEYRVELVNAETTLKESRDFVIGWCMYVPQVNKVGQRDELSEGEVQLDLILGPGLTIFGEVLWDQGVARKDKKLFVKMAMVLSSNEESAQGMLSADDRRMKEEQMLKQAQEQIHRQVQESLEGGKRKDQEKLRAIQEENERLKREKEALELMNRQQPEELLNKHAASSQEVESLKEYYKGRNQEIEELIDTVLKQQQFQADGKDHQ